MSLCKNASGSCPYVSFLEQKIARGKQERQGLLAHIALFKQEADAMNAMELERIAMDTGLPLEEVESDYRALSRVIVKPAGRSAMLAAMRAKVERLKAEIDNDDALIQMVTFLCEDGVALELELDSQNALQGQEICVTARTMDCPKEQYTRAV